VGVVDAHPSKQSLRPTILDLLSGKRLHFVCLTHPHADHGVDLIPVLTTHPNIEAFWHTIFDIPAFIYGVEQTANFPSPVRNFASKMNQDWGEFLVDILAAVVIKKIQRHHLRSDLLPQIIDGVEVHCLSPNESIQNEFSNAYLKKLKNAQIKVPDPNFLSAVLALRFEGNVILLGADALKKNWEGAIDQYHKRSLPKAAVIKVPHHGARNAMDLQSRTKTYLDICQHQPKAKAVIFAGDAKHPDPSVFDKLKAKTTPICLSNGRKLSQRTVNPLKLLLPGATAVYPAPVCNPIVSFELSKTGEINVIAGVSCEQGCSL
jgi:hypothetical protein